MVPKITPAFALPKTSAKIDAVMGVVALHDTPSTSA
jgi:hypothetical protein